MPIEERSSDAPAPYSAGPPGQDEASSPYELLHGNIDEVISEWRELVSAEPWATVSPARLMNSLPEMLPRLFRLAEEGAREMNLELSAFIAREHGFFRREDGIPLGALADEWNHVKRACWKVLQRHGYQGPVAMAAIERLDALIDDAIGFSLRGYYAPELDSLRGRGLERRGPGYDRRAGSQDRRDRS